MDNKVNITYETLFEILRREKTREALQKLDVMFFDEVVSYLKEKKTALEQLKTKMDLFAVEELRKSEMQHDNTRKIIKELYEKREKKIINMAIDASRTFSSVMDTSSMLDKEKMFFEHLVNTLDRFRKGILFNVMEAALPQIDVLKQEEAKAEDKKLEEIKEKMIRFKNAVPKFFGENLEEYGPFEKEDIAKLPAAIADVLIEKDRAEEMNET